MCTFPTKETMTIEFKSDKNCLPDSDIIDVVVAFANTEGGTLYLGLEDDGTVTGLHKQHRDIHGVCTIRQPVGVQHDKGNAMSAGGHTRRLAGRADNV